MADHSPFLVAAFCVRFFAARLWLPSLRSSGAAQPSFSPAGQQQLPPLFLTLPVSQWRASGLIRCCTRSDSATKARGSLPPDRRLGDHT